MSLLPKDNLLANVRHVDVALVITRVCAGGEWETDKWEGTERGRGQLANANSQMEIPVLQKPRLGGGGGGGINYSRQINCTTDLKLPFSCTPALPLIEWTRGHCTYFEARPRCSWSHSDWAWSARSCCVSRASCWTPGFAERAAQKRRRPCCARRRSPCSRRFARGPSPPSSLGTAAVSFARPLASARIFSPPEETQSSLGTQQKEKKSKSNRNGLQIFSWLI